MRIEFQERLDTLAAAIQEQGEICIRALRGAVSALVTQDVELCDEVIAFDDEIDARYHRIEKLVEEVLRSGDARCDRPPVRAREPPHLDPPRADR